MTFNDESPCSILSIEDDTDTCDVLAPLIAGEGHPVTAAGDCDTAHTSLKRSATPPTLILLAHVDGDVCLSKPFDHNH